ncbi:cache domain-containing protein, partial [Rhodoplanes sp. SY1]|uniref:cache domain-containing protein n=1 Tax=Rhodoplanes sp. SY1 TaxID=3166646 RepID=UPI0038B51784
MLSKVRFTIGRRIYAVIGLGFLGILGITWLDSAELASSLKTQRQYELQHLTDLAIAIVAGEDAVAKAAGLPPDEAQKRAQARLAALRYGGNEYFFVADMQGRMVMHPIARELVGTDVTNLKDADGVRIIGGLIDLVRRDGRGVLAYAWPKPGADRPQPKISYAAGYGPWNWIVATGVYVDDLEAQTWAATRRALLAAGVVLLITLAVSMVAARGITNPLQRMTSTMKSLAAGSLDVAIPGTGRRDEIGEMAEAVAVFKANAIERQRLEAEQKEVEARAEAQRREDMHRLADRFETAVGGIIATVSSAATELEATATTLTRTADTTQRMSGTVSVASEEASTNVQAVAAATNEMSSSVGEISRQVQASSRIADEAVRQAEKTDARVTDLSQAATRIGDVVKLITAIAEQTNLLALNATIEAA